MSRVESPKYAKLSPPRVHEAVLRHRLFGRIDTLREKHAVIWIASPPGAGKTTLAASYLGIRKANSIWFQVDSGDADPETFFYFLAETARKRKPALPWLAPELSNNIPHFARLFFREFYARLPKGTVVVFDNIHEFDWTNFAELMEIAFSEVPEGINIIALSRDAPPSRLARLELTGQLAILGWDDLRLDGDETHALLHMSSLTDPLHQVWLERIDGWAAGLVMLREHFSKYPADRSLPSLEGREVIFRYFAGEIFGRMPEAWQRLLLLLSCLPGVSAEDAQQLARDPAAGKVLSQLYQQRLFVDRRGPPPYTYHFHALFREFLQYEADQRLSADERTALLGRAGSILDSQGRTDEAARLYRDAQSYSRLASLLLREAGSMLSNGRAHAWREWLSWLPSSIVDAEPWLCYWQGVSLNYVAPAEAREVLAAAERAFHSAGDVSARLRTIAAIVDSYVYEWSGFQTLSQWIEIMLGALSDLDLDTLSPEIDLKIHSSLTLALCFTTGDSPILARCAQRALDVLPKVQHPAEQLAAGAMLLNYFNYSDVSKARDIIDSLNHLADTPLAGPVQRLWWWRRTVYRYQFDGDFKAAEATLRNARQLIADCSLPRFQFQVDFQTGFNLLCSQNLSACRTLLDEMNRAASPARRLEICYIKILESVYYAQTGDLHASRRSGEEAAKIGEESNLPASTHCQITFLLACSCALGGDIEAALRWADASSRYAHGTDKTFASLGRLWISAYACHVRGAVHDAVLKLRDFYREERPGPIHLSIIFAFYPRLSSTLFALSLQEGIDTQYVRSLITRYGLMPPDRLVPNWPHAVAIRCLGNVELRLHDEVVNPSGKAQRRPLMLLKALVAARGNGRAHEALANELWPDAEDAKAALNVTIHRLRKLLKSDDAIVVSNGTVALSDALAWTDIGAMAELGERIDLLGASSSPEEIRHLASCVMDLYRGPFCSEDEDSWLLPVRERWRSRFLHAASVLGRLLERSKDWSNAQDLYMRALEAEPLAEALYCGVIRCAHARHDPSAALATYRRCRENLSVVLGRQPSPETEKLVLSLGLK